MSTRSPIRLITVRRISSSAPSRGKFSYKDLQKKTNCDRALEHFDDFYGTFFGKRKWPILRLGLLSPTKYVAIPNPFTGNMENTVRKLEALGAHNLKNIWEDGRAVLAKERKEFDMKRDLGNIHSLERTLESIAVTKRAEEMEVLYQNDPDWKGVHPGSLSSSSSGTQTLNAFSKPSEGEGVNRAISHPSQAAFMPTTRLKGVDEFAFDSQYYEGFLPQNFRPLLDPDDDHPFAYSDPTKVLPIKWPLLFLPHSFEPGSGQNFPGSERDPGSGLREYICVNGASIAPILALDLNPSVDLLDLCSGPGTKSLMALLTMSLGSITCNDLDSSRLYRVKRILNEFTGSEQPEIVSYTKCTGTDYPRGRKFDRILADVPCLNDRVSCNVTDNSIFKTTRTRERLNLVHVQKAILHSALKTMSRKEGSVTVYSTCTLSPVENDGVIMHTLKETEVENLVVDMHGLYSLLQPLERKGFFRLSRTRFGVLIEPNISTNFGPFYLCRIIVQKQLGSDVLQPSMNDDTVSDDGKQ